MTIVVQGLTLPWLVRRMDLIDDGTEEEREELSRPPYGHEGGDEPAG